MRILDEDKVVKFDGQTFPKFGWCVILAGGAGSGKGYSFNNYVPIEGMKYDPDEIKRLNLLTWKVEEHDLEDDMLVLSNGDKVSLEGIGKPYNTTNPKFTSLVHDIVKPQTKRFKKFIKDKASEHPEGRLPNIIFDLTMSEIGDYEAIIPEMHDIGYKIAIVYVFTNFDRAVKQNIERAKKAPKFNMTFNNWEFGRAVSDEIMFATHKGMFNALDKLMGRNDLIRQVDGIWVIMTDIDSRIKVFDVKDGDEINFNKNDTRVGYVNPEIEQFIKDNVMLILQREYEYEISKINEKFNPKIKDLFDI